MRLLGLLFCVFFSLQLREVGGILSCDSDSSSSLLLSCHSVEMGSSVNLLLQSGQALLEQVAECQIMGMFAAP